MRSAEPIVQDLSPCPDAWEVALRFSGDPHLLFLESVDRHSERGRFSFVSADPVQWYSGRVYPEIGHDPFAFLAKTLDSFSMQRIPGLPPFQGGCAGLLGYGIGPWMESVSPPKMDEFGIPDFGLGVYDWVIGFDHSCDRAWLFSTGYPKVEESARMERAQARLRQVLERLDQKTPITKSVTTAELPLSQLAPQFPLPGHRKITSNFEPSGFCEVIRRAREYVHAGDCFQVNISQRLLAPSVGPAIELYARLRRANPAPFAGYLDLGDFAIASASPERFLKLTEKVVETRPIKGTRARGKTIEEDRRIVQELEGCEKDRSENIMIVDLMRNDLGRVCEYGSVRVERLCEVESYPFVHHLVSRVVGKLRRNQSAVDLLCASFPGGSVTGAPKVRAMQIIAELEPTARGPYTGSLAYFGFNGTMDCNILIRTFTVGKGWVQFPVGGGIVADSDPQREYEETLHKAKGLLQSL